MNARQNIVVIGGGILGASTAAHLARRGAQVTLVTEGSLASGASGRSIAWLNSAGYRSPEYHALRVAGIDRYRSWSARVPGSGDYLRFPGGVTWADPGESLREQYLHEKSLGYDTRWLRRDEIDNAAAGIDVDSVAEEGAILNPGEGWVDLPSIIANLAEHVRFYGGRVIEDAGRASVEVHGGAATGVKLGSGDVIPADVVVVAAGPSSPEVLGEVGVGIPTESPVALVAFTRPIDIDLRVVLNTPRVAVRRTVSGGLALDSAWSEEAIVVEDGRPRVDDDVVSQLLDEGSRVLKGNPVLELDRIGMGYKPIPGGGEPVIGAVDSVSGLFVAFTHSGATLGILVGELLSDEILEGLVSPLLTTFRPGRFRN